MKPTEHLSRNTKAVADNLAAMIKREFSASADSCSSRRSRGGYLSSRGGGGYLDPSYPTMVTSADRTKLVDWCYDVVDHCKLSRETVASAMEMVDRFLSLPSTSNSTSADVAPARVSDEALRDEDKLQLLTATALYVSIKLNEQVAIAVGQFSSEVCHHAYSAKEIEGMESTLLSGLSWRCHAPTAHQVGLSILSLLLPYVDISEETWGILMDDMTYLTELAVRDYYFSTQRTSTIALAAILNVINDMTTGLKDLLRAYLGVIVESFDFDHPKQVTAAMKRLRLLATANAPDHLDVAVDMDERSLDDDSVKTRKVTNASSQISERDLEVSLSLWSSLSDVTGWSDSDLYDLSCNDHYYC